MAKGLTSAYVQLGAVGMRQHIADHFKENPFPGGLTYNSHPLACAAALATIRVMEEDDLVARAQQTGASMSTILNGPEMSALNRFFRQEGLYTFVRWNYFFTNPPLSITEAELREGFDIIDRALAETDKAVM
jgi:taurine--2-oxoglutarate transaminase